MHNFRLTRRLGYDVIIAKFISVTSNYVMQIDVIFNSVHQSSMQSCRSLQPLSISANVSKVVQ